MVMSRRSWMTGAGTVGALGLIGTPLAWAAPLPAGTQRFVVGQSIPQTGAASDIGLAFAAGTKMYVDEFNSKPVSGLHFELHQMDDGYDPDRAAGNARKLLANGADALFGFVGTESSNAAEIVAQKQNAIFFAPFAGADNLRDGTHPNVFNVRPSMADEAFKIVRHCATIGQTRIAVMAEDDAMGRAGLQAVNAAIAELKLPPLVDTVFVPTNSSDVGGAAATLAKSNPQVIIQAALFTSAAAFIQKMRKTGYVGMFMNYSVVGINPLFLALDKDIRGVVVSQVVPSPRSTSTAVVREYLAVIENTDQFPTYESLEGFIAAKALVEGVRRAGRGASTASLQKAFATMTAYDVGGFRINLRAGVRDSAWGIELVSLTADGRVLR